jgi:hypothetical protein
VKASGADIIIHECVPGFDPSILQQCLHPLYTVQSLVWNAADEGLPIRRERRYTICIRKGSFGIPLLRFNSSVWSSLVFCSRVATGDIFLHASDEHLSHLRQDLCFRKGFPPVRVRSNGADGVWAWEVLMSKSERDVLLSLRQKAEVFKAEHPDIDISKHKWLVNVTQSEKFQLRCRNFQLDLVPALLRSSKFFLDCLDQKKSRFVHPLEVMAMQGLPVLLPADHFACESCNFEKTLHDAGIALQQMAALSGNGMNLSSIGQVLFFCLACLDTP